MKTLKLGSLNIWQQLTAIGFPGVGNVGVTLRVLSIVDTLMSVYQHIERVDADTGEFVLETAPPYFVAINRGEMTEIVVELNHGGTIEFDHEVMVATRNNRSNNFENTGPIFVEPMQPRRRDPVLELTQYQARQREAARLKKDNELRDQLERLTKDLNRERADKEKAEKAASKEKAKEAMEKRQELADKIQHEEQLSAIAETEE